MDTRSTDSYIPLSPSNILTSKVNIIMSPPEQFIREDLYCHRRWRRVQYLASQFWRLEFLLTLQERKKWIRSQREMKIGDIVLIVDDNLPCNKWPLVRVLETSNDKDGYVRTVKVLTGKSTYERSVHKLILLLDLYSNQ